MRAYGLRSLVFAVLALLAILAPAQAGVLTGDTIQVQYFFPDLSHMVWGPATVTAPGTILGVDYGTFDLQVGDSSITVSSWPGCPGCYWTGAAFNGFVLTDLSNSPITSVTVDPSTTMPGFTAANVSWAGNQISVNWPGLTLTGTMRLDLGGSVPEPSTWLLLGTSLAGLLAWRRRRRA